MNGQMSIANQATKRGIPSPILKYFVYSHHHSLSISKALATYSGVVPMMYTNKSNRKAKAGLPEPNFIQNLYPVSLQEVQVASRVREAKTVERRATRSLKLDSHEAHRDDRNIPKPFEQAVRISNSASHMCNHLYIDRPIQSQFLFSLVPRLRIFQRRLPPRSPPKLSETPLAILWTLEIQSSS
ncbi:hypothetical protein BDW59DRAFT_152426 [Aspergillus cavernicola]|uniref:Uncharacterized protein n=1 Tax=Aspergillus cavernicola TaxID=176166 RepID=A0ABR4HSS5_9EURO